MRIACVHLPAFPLQVELARRPELADRPVAVLTPAPHPQIAFASRAARAAGVRPGMAALAARAAAPDLVAIEPAEAVWREALVELAAALAELAPAVEVDGGWSVLLEVPAGRKSADLARQVQAAVERRGFFARVGVAGDRFTAGAAARFGGEPVTVVRRGQSAAFLAPLSIDLLPLPAEVRSMLRAAGVKTLGQFAALPPPSVARPSAVDYRELARGNGPSRLTPFGARRAPARRALAAGRQLPLARAQRGEPVTAW